MIYLTPFCFIFLKIFLLLVLIGGVLKKVACVFCRSISAGFDGRPYLVIIAVAVLTGLYYTGIFFRSISAGANGRPYLLVIAVAVLTSLYCTGILLLSRKGRDQNT